LSISKEEQEKRAQEVKSKFENQINQNKVIPIQETQIRDK